MFRYFFTFWQIWFHIQANTVLYYLQKLPVFKRLLPDSIFRLKHVKAVACAVGAIAAVIGRFITRSALVWVLIFYIPEMIIKTAPSVAEMSCLFLLIECLAPLTRGSEIVSAKAEDYLFLNHFFLNPDVYYRLKIVKLLLLKVLPVIPILVYLLGDCWMAAMLVILSLFFFAAGNSLYLKIYSIKHKLWSQRIRLMICAAIVLLSYIALYFGVLDNRRISRLLAYIAIPAGAVISAFFLRFLFRFREYKSIAIQFASKDVISLKVSVSTPLNEDATSFTLSDWKTNQTYFSSYSKTDPFLYIEKAFRRRIRKVLSSYLQQTLFINLVGGTVLGILIRNNLIQVDSSNIMRYSPMLILLLSNMRSGTAYIPMVFRHMDMPMLYHRLYSPRMIVKSIKLRCAWLLRRGVISLGAMFLGIIALLQIGKIHVPYTDLLQIMLGYLFVFYGLELVNLSLYYLIQPYQSDLTTKSPLFSIYQIFESLLSWLAVFARENLSRFILPFAAFFLVSVVLLLIALRLAPKTFRLR